MVADFLNSDTFTLFGDISVGSRVISCLGLVFGVQIVALVCYQLNWTHREQNMIDEQMKPREIHAHGYAAAMKQAQQQRHSNNTH
jgi:hypothetical protein